tara:strand:+ start:440 stop:643 length:204 start_codon:yes stop_codon:yes gene_type:complete
MKKKINQSLNVIKKIENIRSKNNKNWMDLLRLSFKLDPKNSSTILKKITDFDKRISKLTNKLQKLNK